MSKQKLKASALDTAQHIKDKNNGTSKEHKNLFNLSLHRKKAVAKNV